MLPAYGGPPADGGEPSDPEPRRLRAAVLSPWIAETLLAIGAPPVALPELERGARVWGPPDLPAGIADLGLAGEPNIELLEQLHLDLILADRRLQGWILPRLEPVAPVVAAAIYTDALSPLSAARAETARFGDLLHRRAEAACVVAEADATFGRARAMLSSCADRPFFVVRLIDDRNLMLYCRGSLFHEVLVELGLPPASPAANDWGFLTVGIETLAAVPDARVIHFEPLPKEARSLFIQPSLWSHLPAVRDGFVTPIPDLYSWGGLPTAKRFADELALALAGPAPCGRGE
jgi:iron complex transport system substrate-binding protein